MKKYHRNMRFVTGGAADNDDDMAGQPAILDGEFTSSCCCRDGMSCSCSSGTVRIDFGLFWACRHFILFCRDGMSSCCHSGTVHIDFGLFWACGQFRLCVFWHA